MEDTRYLAEQIVTYLGPAAVWAVLLGGTVWGLVYLVDRFKRPRQDQAASMQSIAQEAAKAAQEQLSALIATLMARVAKLEEDNKELRRDNANLRDEFARERHELERQINALRQQIVLLESAHQDLPLPQWLKDEKGTVLAVNRAYVETFLLPRGYTQADYVGSDDFAVWPEEVARVFKENDAEVWRTGRVFNDAEPIEAAGGEIVNYHIIKYTRFAGGQRIGIAGIAIPPIEQLKRMEL